MRIGLVIGFLLVGSVAHAQAPTLQIVLEQAEANLAKRVAAMQASDVYKDYVAARDHVATVKALIAAKDAKP